MITVQSATLVDEIERLAVRLEHDAEVGSRARPVLDDIRAMRRDLDALERELLEVNECEGLRGDAC